MLSSGDAEKLLVVPQVAALSDIGEDIFGEVEFLRVWWVGGGGMVSSVVIMR
jgi:hypothetical protein